MPTPELRRKPPVALPPQSKEPVVLRMEPRDIERLRSLATARGVGHCTLARTLLLTALTLAELEDAMQSHTRITA